MTLTPTDLRDPAKFGQIAETTKDAFVEEIRRFLNQPTLNTTDADRRREIPTVRKYAVGFGPETDPYETVTQILQEFADTEEHLPHIAVTAVQGQNAPLSLGQPITSHVQNPPRVTTANPQGAGYALGGSLAEIRSVTVNAVVVGFTYVATLQSQDFPYVAQAGDSADDVARGLRDALRGAEPVFIISVENNVVTIRASDVNTPFTLTVSANLTAALVQAAGTAPTDQLVFRTTPSRRPNEPVVETITFTPNRFPPANPVTAALAADVALVFNEQARFAHAEEVTLAGGGQGVRLFPGGPSGGFSTPNEIEVLADSSASLIAVLGLGSTGTDVTIAVSIAGVVTVTATGVGTGVTAQVPSSVDGYVTLAGLPDSRNNGRFRVLSTVDADNVTIENADAVAEASATATWFVGARDDWRNITRPVSTRRSTSFSLAVTMSVLAESPNARTELLDLLINNFAYYLELQFFAILGRGVLDYDNFPDEVYQIAIASEITYGGDAATARPDDPKNQVYESRANVAVRTTWYQDRSLLVPFGPNVNRSWVVTADDITQVDNGTVENDFTPGC